MKRAAVILALTLAAPTTARAWDPSRTHVGITERAVVTSDVHRRWMEGSGQELGWFTPIRVDPSALDASTRRALVVAMRVAHADVGSIAAGGPGACPPQPAPSETLQRCVDGDVWETSALGWLRIGVALETADRTRLLHHFVDGSDPSKPTWRASGRRRSTWRRIERRAGGAAATRIGGAGFSGAAMSAIGWLHSDADPFGPAALFAHQRSAALAVTQAERDRHLALALVATGALLHVVQDLAVPAHARGDLLGTRVPLSGVYGDRGSPLAEYARITFGRTMPEPISLTTRTEAVPEPTSLRELILGGPAREGLVDLAGGRFLSDGSLPAPKVIDSALDGAAAATSWLGEGGAGLAPEERDGAVLAPWPAESGYLRTKSGRALAAWTADEDGLVRGYIDRRVLREHALVLLPAAVEASVDTLELLWPLWPEMRHDTAQNLVEVGNDPALRERELDVLVQDASGRRTLARRIALLDGWSRVRDITPAALPTGSHVVLVITGKRADGQRIAIERRLDAAPLPKGGPKPSAPPPPVEDDDAPEDETDEEPAEAPPAETPPAEAPPAETPPAETTTAPLEPGAPPRLRSSAARP
jgi:hypothetical protein